MVRLFRGAKRKTPLSVSITFDGMIPRPDFIEMMEDSYETSIIDFLAQEFLEQIVSDTDRIREAIRAQIVSVVYPGGKVGPESAGDPDPAPPAAKAEPRAKPASGRRKKNQANDTPVAD